MFQAFRSARVLFPQTNADEPFDVIPQYDVIDQKQAVLSLFFLVLATEVVKQYFMIHDLAALVTE